MSITNKLFFGDNLEVLRKEVKDETIDLIYLDPPFNSNANYNVLFQSQKGEDSHAQIEAFEDTWHWGAEAELEFQGVLKSQHVNVASLLVALRSFLGENDMMAYLVMMANRLIELHRTLRSSGCLYLHCDPTASHYLKILLDAIFGSDNFLSEIAWKRTGTHSSAKRWGPIHDVIFYYQKGGDEPTWNRPYAPHSEKHLRTHYKKMSADGRAYEHGELTGAGVRNGRSGEPWRGFDVTSIGRHWVTTVDKLDALYEEGRIYLPETGGWPRLIRFEDESKGRAVGDIWDDISPINMRAKERLGYPTQKPLELLERIISASSNPGDTVLDPFCGCGTAVHAAEKLGRKWVGIDITHLAISLIEKRMKDAFPKIEIEVHGTPKDLDSARDLAIRDKYQFQWWACSLVNAQPFGGKKKGADGGIDGLIYVQDDPKKANKIIVSVKGGDNVQVSMIRDLAHVVEREKAIIGLFVTLAEPTTPMTTEAVKTGFYDSPVGKSYPKIQILTIEGLLSGRERANYPDLSLGGITFKKAPVEKKDVGQEELF